MRRTVGTGWVARLRIRVMMVLELKGRMAVIAGTMVRVVTAMTAMMVMVAMVATAVMATEAEAIEESRGASNLIWP